MLGTVGAFSFLQSSEAATTAYFSTSANETMETTKTVNQYEIWQIKPDNAAGNRISGPSLDGILSTSGRDFDAVYEDATHWYFSVQQGTTDVDYTGGSLENVDSNKIVRYDKASGVANIWFDAGTYTGAGSQVDAMHIAPGGDLLLSFDDSETFTVGAMGSMTLNDGDIIRVPITEAGGVATATAVPTLLLEESVVFQDNEDIEGFSYWSDDAFYLITESAGQFKTGAMLIFSENDVLQYNPATEVASVLITAGTFDSTNAFDLNALHVVPEPGFYALIMGAGLFCFAFFRRNQNL